MKYTVSPANQNKTIRIRKGTAEFKLSNPLTDEVVKAMQADRVLRTWLIPVPEAPAAEKPKPTPSIEAKPIPMPKTAEQVHGMTRQDLRQLADELGYVYKEYGLLKADELRAYMADKLFPENGATEDESAGTNE